MVSSGGGLERRLGVRGIGMRLRRVAPGVRGERLVEWLAPCLLDPVGCVIVRWKAVVLWLTSSEVDEQPSQDMDVGVRRSPMIKRGGSTSPLSTRYKHSYAFIVELYTLKGKNYYLDSLVELGPPDVSDICGSEGFFEATCTRCGKLESGVTQIGAWLSLSAGWLG